MPSLADLEREISQASGNKELGRILLDALGYWCESCALFLVKSDSLKGWLASGEIAQKAGDISQISLERWRLRTFERVISNNSFYSGQWPEDFFEDSTLRQFVPSGDYTLLIFPISIAGSVKMLTFGWTRMPMAPAIYSTIVQILERAGWRFAELIMAKKAGLKSTKAAQPESSKQPNEPTQQQQQSQPEQPQQQQIQAVAAPQDEQPQTQQQEQLPQVQDPTPTAGQPEPASMLDSLPRESAAEQFVDPFAGVSEELIEELPPPEPEPQQEQIANEQIINEQFAPIDTALETIEPMPSMEELPELQPVAEDEEPPTSETVEITEEEADKMLRSFGVIDEESSAKSEVEPQDADPDLEDWSLAFQKYMQQSESKPDEEEGDSTTKQPEPQESEANQSKEPEEPQEPTDSSRNEGSLEQSTNQQQEDSPPAQQEVNEQEQEIELDIPEQEITIDKQPETEESPQPEAPKPTQHDDDGIVIEEIEIPKPDIQEIKRERLATSSNVSERNAQSGIEIIPEGLKDIPEMAQAQLAETSTDESDDTSLPLETVKEFLNEKIAKLKERYPSASDIPGFLFHDDEILDFLSVKVSEEALEWIWQKMSSSDPHERAIAAYSCCSVYGGKLTTALIRLLDDESTAISQLAAKVLITRRGDPNFEEYRDILLSDLESKDRPKLERAIRRFGILRDPLAVHPLMYMLQNTDDTSFASLIMDALTKITCQYPGGDKYAWFAWWRNNKDLTQTHWFILALTRSSLDLAEEAQACLHALHGRQVEWMDLSKPGARGEAYERWSKFWSDSGPAD